MVEAKRLTGDEEALASFGAEVRGDVLGPEDEGYDTARRVWNGMIDRYPALIVRCTGTADVIASVNFAVDYDLEVSVRGGGHNTAGNAVCDDGLVIDLSEMNAVWVDPEERVAHVQGGATWADFDHEAQTFGLATTGGVISDTGVGGLTLGGGYGYLRRKYGWTVDNLRSVDLVTVDGELVHASESENEDLFWAVRGGGGNFGVVTMFEFDLHEVGPMVGTAAVIYPAREATAVLSGWRDYTETAPDEVSSQVIFMDVPVDHHYPEEIHGENAVVVVGVHAGPAEEGVEAMAPLRELADPLSDMTGVFPYVGLQSFFDGYSPAGEDRWYAKSLNLAGLDDDAIETIVARATDRAGSKTLVQVLHMGGAMARVDDDATPIPDRDAPYLLSIDCAWTDAADDEANIAWARGFWDDVQAFATGGLYLNFAGTENEANELARSGYGVNYERLVEVKKKYDPTNFFHRNQNISPAT